MIPRSWVGAAGLVLAAALGCGPPSGPPPRVEFGRCYAVDLPGPVCGMWEGREIYLWVPAGKEKIEVRAGDRLLEPLESELVQGGWRLRVRIPPSETSLSVSLASPGGSRSAPWRLAVADSQRPDWDEEIARLGKSGRLTDLVQIVPAKERGEAYRALASLARGDGNVRQAEAFFRHGIAWDRKAGRLSGEVENSTQLVGLFLEQGRFSEARQALSRLPDLSRDAPGESKLLAGFYRGLLAGRVGDYRTALQELQEAMDLGERLGNPVLRSQAAQVLANLLQDLGRSAEAGSLFEQIAAAKPYADRPCEQGDLLTSWAWSRLLQREGGASTADPLPFLEDAKALYAHPDCTPQQRLNARLNLALAHQQEGRWPQAGEALGEARRLAFRGTFRDRLWQLDLEGRQAIETGEPARALGLYRDLEGLAQRFLSFEGRFRASFGKARVLLALGRRAEAREALKAADRRVDEEIWHVPAYGGRDTLVAQRQAASNLYLDLLLQSGDLPGALALARRARSRLLHHLELRDRLSQLQAGEQEEWERVLSRYLAARSGIDEGAAQEWSLAADERRAALADRIARLETARADLDRAIGRFVEPPGEGPLDPPKPGEVILVYHPLPEGRWVGFAADDHGIDIHRFGRSEAQTFEKAPDRLIAPFHASLARASTVRVLPYGPLRSIDFHVLPFEGALLLARKRVVYGLDLQSRPDPQPMGARSALVVADPEGNLPAARAEARQVEQSVRGWKTPWTLTTLSQKDARAGDILRRLGSTSLFHYAGHGTFGGFAGWDSVLSLSNRTSLTLSDLQTLRRAPEWVILSSCEAGRASEAAPGEGIGIANAFLLAGSQVVIAATRRVPDEIARDLMSELYRGWDGSDLPSRFQHAQLLCLAHHPPGAGCESFRLFEP